MSGENVAPNLDGGGAALMVSPELDQADHQTVLVDKDLDALRAMSAATGEVGSDVDAAHARARDRVDLGAQMGSWAARTAEKAARRMPRVALQ